MTIHGIRVSGCDDATHVNLDLTETELAVVRRLAAALEEASSYSCQPTMRVFDGPTDTGEDDE